MGGIGIGGALLITFLVLKLAHVIDWSWWWVLSPAWIPAAFVLVIVAATAAAAAGKGAGRSISSRRRRRRLARRLGRK